MDKPKFKRGQVVYDSEEKTYVKIKKSFSDHESKFVYILSNGEGVFSENCFRKLNKKECGE